MRKFCLGWVKNPKFSRLRRANREKTSIFTIKSSNFALSGDKFLEFFAPQAKKIWGVLRRRRKKNCVEIFLGWWKSKKNTGSKPEFPPRACSIDASVLLFFFNPRGYFFFTHNGGVVHIDLVGQPGFLLKIASRLPSGEGVDLIRGGYRYYFWAFQLELNRLGSKNFAIGSVVAKLQSIVFGEIFGKSELGWALVLIQAVVESSSAVCVQTTKKVSSSFADFFKPVQTQPNRIIFDS